MALKDYSARDKYTYPNSPVLINLADIKDGERLEQFEADRAFRRLLQLANRPLEGPFDFEHLKPIHFYIFQDVYSWAGQVRTVNISKGTSTFGFHQYIEAHLRQTLGGLAEENYLRGLATQAFVTRSSHYLAEINAAHPFREGNGRTQREFISELALKAGFRINGNGASRDELYAASEEGMAGRLGRLIALMMPITERLAREL